MTRHIIIVNKAQSLSDLGEAARIVTPQQYISKQFPDEFSTRPSSVRVINLCNDYEYLGLGYYCSLLAEARGHKVIPSVSVTLDLNWKRIYQAVLPEINEYLSLALKKNYTNGTGLVFRIFFGRTLNAEVKELARKIFDAFRCPLLEVKLVFEGSWEVESIEPIALGDVLQEEREFLVKSIKRYTRASWPSEKVLEQSLRYSLAILHDPEEKIPPSNPEALKKFVRIGESLGINVELITRKDVSKLLEYDALLIRETTSVNHHTYRFAKKAEAEGMAVIDDAASIVRCGNKVYLAELLASEKIPTPQTIIFDKSQLKEMETKIIFPTVLKIPDGCFSMGVHKAADVEEFRKVAKSMFEDSDIILAQEFVRTEFDWRIGVLNGQPLFACKYFMANGHWQVINHSSSEKEGVLGKTKTFPVEEVPKQVISLAVKASNLIGHGLYGVDIKQLDKGLMVIEVNDNPDIDSGVEDEYLGDELYRKILLELVRRLEL